MRAYEFIFESVKGNENSLGKPIAHSDQALKNFWKWFRGSKVVDSAGRPLVMYHGTGADFAKFGYEFADKGVGAHGMGFYFTSAPSTASGYASGEYPNVMPVYLNIKKPMPSNYKRLLNRAQLRRIITMSPGLDDALYNYGDVEYEGKERVLSGAIEAFVDSADTLLGQLNMIANDFFRGHNEAFLKAAIAVTGFDGVKHGFDSEVFFIAWDHHQITSAVGNRGGYTRGGDSMVDESNSDDLMAEHMNSHGVITELFDSPVPYTWYSQDEESWEAEFDIGDVHYEFVTGLYTNEDDGYTEAEIEFFHRNERGAPTHQITGVGNEHQVFATIVAIMSELLSNVKIDTIIYSAKEPNRVRLYNRMIAKLLPNAKTVKSGNKFLVRLG